MESKYIAAIAIGVLVVATVVTGIVVYYSLKIRGRGSIKTVGVNVFQDPGCTIPVGEIDWGIIPQGGRSEALLYVKNTGNSNITLSFNSEAWSPAEAKSYMTLGWDYNGTILMPDQSVPVILSLDISETIQNVTDFSFDIIITATG